MIGIISHVSDLKDRIGTQTRVHPHLARHTTDHVVVALGNVTSNAVQ